MVVADAANGHAVLPAFMLGLVMARHYQAHRSEEERLRVVAFAFPTPSFFLRGGLVVSLGAVIATLGLLAVLAAAKMLPKLALILPLARRHAPEHATFTTLRGSSTAPSSRRCSPSWCCSLSPHGPGERRRATDPVAAGEQA
jgi:Kef-type K+ transport system membrane component KefB